MSIDGIVKILEENEPPCTNEHDRIVPSMYVGDPQAYCPYEDYCAFKGEKGTYQTCNYFDWLSLIDNFKDKK